MSWLFNPTRSEITSLDSGNIDDILSEYFEFFFSLQSLICVKLTMLNEYAYPRFECMNCKWHRSSKLVHCHFNDYLKCLSRIPGILFADGNA